MLEYYRHMWNSGGAIYLILGGVVIIVSLAGALAEPFLSSEGRHYLKKGHLALTTGILSCFVGAIIWLMIRCMRDGMWD